MTIYTDIYVGGCPVVHNLSYLVLYVIPYTVEEQQLVLLVKTRRTFNKDSVGVLGLNNFAEEQIATAIRGWSQTKPELFLNLKRTSSCSLLPFFSASNLLKTLSYFSCFMLSENIGFYANVNQ